MRAAAYVGRHIHIDVVVALVYMYTYLVVHDRSHARNTDLMHETRLITRWSLLIQHQQTINNAT